MLARSSFAEEKLKNDIKLGCKNYLIVASGYDTYAYRDPKIKVYEIDKKEMIIDKINRVERAKLNHKNVEYVTCDLAKDNLLHLLELSNYNKNEKSFVSLLGITYYLTKSEFSKLLNDFQFLIKGSTIVFDYPTKENSIVMEKKF